MNGRLANRMADDPVNDKVSRQLADLYSKKKFNWKDHVTLSLTTETPIKWNWITDLTVARNLFQLESWISWTDALTNVSNKISHVASNANQ